MIMLRCRAGYKKNGGLETYHGSATNSTPINNYDLCTIFGNLVIKQQNGMGCENLLTKSPRNIISKDNPIMKSNVVIDFG